MNAATLRLMDTNKESLDKLRSRLKGSLKKRVAKAREDMHYSQPDVLEELKRYGLGRTQGSISQIENGVRLPSVETLYVIAKYLDTSSDYFLGLTDNPLSAQGVEEELANANGEGKINKIMSSLPQDKQQQVLQFAEYLLARQGAMLDVRIEDDGEESRRLAREAGKWLDSIERTRGLTVRQEIEKVFRDKNLIIDDGTT